MADSGSRARRYLVVKRWDEFQNADIYKKSGGHPPWIKCYVRLLDDDDYLGLTGDQRAILHGLWIMYARKRRQVAVNTASLSRQLNLRVTSAQLKRLEQAGFIEFSLEPLAKDSPRELDLEKEKSSWSLLGLQSEEEQELSLKKVKSEIGVSLRSTSGKK